MTKKRDRFWEYVQDLKGRFKCNFCQKEFAGGISRIKSHLSGKKGRDIEICLKVPDNVQVEACQTIGSPYKKAKNIAVSISGIGGGINSTSTTSMNDKDAVNKRFIKFILLNNISEDVIRSQAFIDFVKGVSQFGPNYELPNLVHQAKLVLDYDREILLYVRNAKESWAVTGCTLMVDIENGDEHSYVNVFSYCPKGVVFLKSSVTSRDGMTWIYLKDIVSSTIDEIGVDKVLQLIVDNNEGFELTAYMLLEYSQVCITRCAIHGIQSLLMDLFSKVDWFRRITMAGKMILSYIHKHGINLSFQIQKHTKYKKFEHPCLARFASNFLLLHSILEFETELKDLQLLDSSLDWKSLDFNMQELAKWVANVIESTPFWTLVKEVLHIVDILFQVLRLVSGDAPTSGYLYEAMKKASTEIRQVVMKIKPNTS
ncbi:hypothetical protein CsSME_00012446 [Camellia sinensis var. sinensis]